MNSQVAWNYKLYVIQATLFRVVV